MTDIQNREDIEKLVDTFYKRIIVDDQIGHFFTKVVKLDWDKHIPVMYDFWETTLLGNMKYKGNPMIKHIDLNEKARLTSQHFEVWLKHWEQTINENFNGVTADIAKNRARQIGELMKYKIAQHAQNKDLP